MRDEINEPLKKGPEPAPSRLALRRTALVWGFIAAACALGVAGPWLHRIGDSYSRSPLTIARVESDNVVRQLPKSQNAQEAWITPPGSTAFATGEQVEKASGVRVTRNGGGGPSGALIIDVPQALGVQVSARSGCPTCREVKIRGRAANRNRWIATGRCLCPTGSGGHETARRAPSSDRRGRFGP